jgi:hypothetical protein
MRRGAAVLIAVSLAACGEKLTAPGDCPGLCPSDNLVVVDTVIEARLDSTYTGFVEAGEGQRLLLSTGAAGGRRIGVARFTRREDSVSVRDTLFPYVVDSIVLAVTVQGRDRAATGLALEVFQLPATIAVDSTTTFAQVSAALTPDRVIATVPLADTLTSGSVRVFLAGADLSRIVFTPADDNVLRLAYRLTSAQPTGILLASSAQGLPGPSFVTWLRVARPDTTVVRSLPRIVQFDSYLEENPVAVPSPDVTTVGGAPSSRALLRFDLPARIRDSSQIIRATLQLVPLTPIVALAGDSAQLDVRGIFSDLGPKSPRISTSTTLLLTEELTPGGTDTVFVEVTPIARLWHAENRPPTAFFLAVGREGGTFTFAQFGSSRSPAGRPTLRITYVLPYPFEAQ